MSAEHDEIQDSLAAFLFGASDADEAEMVRTHLEGCASCQVVARRLQRAIDAMPLGSETVQPPVRLRERILSAAGVSRQSTRSRPQRARILRIPGRAPRRPSVATLRLGAAVGAAAILAFALGAGFGFGVGRSVAPQEQPAQTVAQFTLTGTGSMRGAQGHAYAIQPRGLTLVQFSGLPEPGQGHVYEMWLLPANGQPVPAGVFVPDTSGSQVVVVTHMLDGFKQLAVTLEVGPDGVAAPTQQPQLVGAIG